MSLSNYFETYLLDQLPSTVYVQLHVSGGPGEDGTSNVLQGTGPANYARQAVTLASTAGSSRSTNAAVSWASLALNTNPSTITDISVWSVGSGGNCLWYGALTTPRSVANGDTFTIASGQLTMTLE